MASEDDTTRRDLLRTGGGLAATGLAFGVAGCTGSIPGLGGGGGGGGSRTAWLVAPSALGTSHYQFQITDFGKLQQHSSKLGSGYQMIKGMMSGALAKVGIKWNELGASISVGQGMNAKKTGSVLTGSFDTGTVGSKITGQGMSKGSSYNGYTMYTKSGGGGGGGGMSFGITNPVMALGSGTIVSGGDKSTVKAIIDAKGGSGERYTQASKDCKKLLNNLNKSGLTVSGGTNKKMSGSGGGGAMTSGPSLKGQVASGNSVAISGSKANGKMAIVFDSASNASKSKVKKWANSPEASSTMGKMKNISTSKSGRVVVVKGSADAKKVFSSGGGSGSGGSGRVAPNSLGLGVF